MEIQFRNETKKLRNNEQTLKEDEVSETNITKLQGTVIELRQEERKVKNNERTDKEWTLSELSVLTNNVEVLKDGMTEVNETKS
jgi:hypothetical protein